MAKRLKSVKINIFLGYITLVIIASATVWLIYNETLELYKNQVDISPVNDKILITNSILTNLYEAEGLERSYLQTGKRGHHKAYNVLMDSISGQIDSLGKIAGSPLQQMHADSIGKLLAKKRQNLKELVAIKNAGSSEKMYEKAMLRLTSNEDSINQLLSIYKTVSTRKDSVIIKQKKKKFFERLVHVFSPHEKPDTTLKVVVNQSMKVDSILNAFNPADSVRQFLSSVIEDIREESVAYEKKLVKKEQDIADNDKTITLQIRQMLSKFKNEELISSIRKVEIQQERIADMTNIIILLGIIALLVITGFLILILQDISRSQHYRQNLEKEKAYSEMLLKSKEQFMLSITHDLKSPLSSIIGYAQLTERENATTQQKSYLENIQQSAEYILRLINDLMDFARLQTGKFKFENIRFNLNDLTDEVISGFYPLAAEKKLELEWQNQLRPDTVYTSDPIRIKQILGNLISNAIKFTDSGKVTVKGIVQKTEDQTDWIQFDVIDTGIGIVAENAPLIFEEFSQVSSEEGRQYEGTGLGLTITKRLIELMNGSITFKSQHRKGSHFTVMFPLQPLPAYTSGKQRMATMPPIPDINQFSFNGEKVLLVDDDSVLLDMTATVLRAARLRVNAFSEPREALKAIRKESFDLLITDIRMPRMSGFELLYFFRKNSSGKARAIAVSGELPRKQVYENAGFSTFLQKPFRPEELLKQVALVMNREKAGLRQIPGNHTKTNSDYNIDAIKAFASDDPETTRDILASFIESTAQNIQLFRQHLHNSDFESLTELAHKMLPMFRQLEAKKVIRPLEKLERNDYGKERKEEWLATGELALSMVEPIMKKIGKDHHISLPGTFIL